MIREKRMLNFFPILYVSLLIITGYLFGLAGQLLTGIRCFYAFSCLMLLPGFFFNKQKQPHLLWSPGIVFMSVAIIWAYAISRRTTITHVDDMAHWYRICKVMSFQNAYPSGRELSHLTYVPGAATWIYGLTKVLGFSASNCIFAQMSFHIACVSCIFALADDAAKAAVEKKLWFLILSVCMAVAFISVAVLSGVYTLLVDTIVALMPLDICCLYADAENSGTEKIFLPSVIIISCAAMLVKASASLFIFPLAVCWLSLPVSDCVVGKKIKQTLQLILLPLIVFGIWQCRIRLIYGDISGSSQAVSISRWINVFRSKPWHLIAEITDNYFRQLGAVYAGISQVKALWITLSSVVIFAAFVKTKSKQRRGQPQLRINIRPMFVIVLLYLTGLLFVYIFSMNTAEANSQHLACFYRYIGTLTIFTMGYTVLLITKTILSFENHKYLGMTMLLVGLLWVGALFQYGWLGGFRFNRPEENYETQVYSFLEENVSESTHTTKDRYLAIWDDGEYFGYHADMQIGSACATYLMTETAVKQATLSDLKRDRIPGSLIEAYDYIIFFGNYENELASLMNRLDPVQNERYVYRVQK